MQVFICLRPPPPLGFCLRSSSNFVGSESGQKQSIKPPAEYMVSIHSSTQLNPPPPVCMYILYFFFGKGGRGGGVVEVNQREGYGAIGHKAGSKILTWLTISPVYKLYITPVKTTFRIWSLQLISPWIFPLLERNIGNDPGRRLRGMGGSYMQL